MNVRRGDIVIGMIDLNPTDGSQQRETRPGLVVQNDVGSENAPTTIVSPFTIFRGDQLYPFEVLVSAEDCVGGDRGITSYIHTFENLSVDTLDLSDEYDRYAREQRKPKRKEHGSAS
jgi:mRNA-degrading endonuclease toxin of MazEF toxin-antitoxin module